MHDRIFGYIGIFFLALFFCVSAILLIDTLTIPIEHRTVCFDNIGSLTVEDPVSLRGNKIGEISDIVWKNHRAYITIATTQPLLIHQGYSIRIIDLGVMGDRLLAIDCGLPQQPIIDKKETLKGTFTAGPAEALAMINDARNVIIGFRDISQLLLKGSPTQPSLIQQYRDIVKFTDSVSTQLTEVAEKIDRVTTTSMDSLTRLIGYAHALSDSLSTNLPAYLKSTDTIVNNLDTLLGKSQEILVRIEPLMPLINAPEDQELVKMVGRLQKQILALEKTVRYLKESGLELKVWPF